jgi:Flp pilus assembly protein TadG
MNIRRHSRRKRGAAIVETSLCLAMLLYMVFVIVDYGMLMFARNQMPYLASEGARWASVRSSASALPTTSTGVRDYVRSQAVGLATANLTVNVSYSGGNSAGSDVIVAVSYPVTPLTKFPITSTMTVSSTAQMEIAQ